MFGATITGDLLFERLDVRSIDEMLGFNDPHHGSIHFGLDENVLRLEIEHRNGRIFQVHDFPSLC